MQASAILNFVYADVNEGGPSRVKMIDQWILTTLMISLEANMGGLA